MDPDDARNILKGIEFIDMIRGSGELKCLESEKVARQNARRSIVSRGDIPKGTVITRAMLTYKRPGTGIAPSQIETVVGRTAAVDIADDTILQTQMFE